MLLVLDLAGTFAFALSGALTALRATRLDVVGVVTLGMVTALGGGTVRDLLLDALPPATFVDGRYLAVAFAGGLAVAYLGPHLQRLATPILVADAAGLALFAVTGASKATALGFGPGQAVVVGAITAVGGGTLRDVMTGRVPTVLRSELYAIPALLGATTTVAVGAVGASAAVAAVAGAAPCLLLRLLAVRFDLHGPFPLAAPGPDPGGGPDPDPRG